MYWFIMLCYSYMVVFSHPLPTNCPFRSILCRASNSAEHGESEIKQIHSLQHHPRARRRLVGALLLVYLAVSCYLFGELSMRFLISRFSQETTSIIPAKHKKVKRGITVLFEQSIVV